jgi:hypothetical protein
VINVRIGIATVVAVTLFAAGCANQTAAPAPNPTAPEQNAAGDIPDDQVFVPYVPADHGFAVDVPEGWARTNDGGAVVFTDKLNTVRIETAARPQAPTVRSVTTDELPHHPHGKVATAHRVAGDAILLTYERTSTPDPVTGRTRTESVERYEFWHQGREVDLTLSGPKGADNIDPWLKVTESLRWPG